MRLFVALLALPLLSLSDACSCSFRHPQQAFCDADYVIVAQVLSEDRPKPSGGSYYPAMMRATTYDILITSVFSGHDKIDALFGKTSGYPANSVEQKIRPHKMYTAKVSTPSMGSLCGVHLSVGTTYLLSGKQNRQALVVTSCDWLDHWSSVGNAIKQAMFDGGFKCDCRISVASHWTPVNGHNGLSGCVFDYSKFHCYAQTKRCERNGKTCSWLSDGSADC